MESLTYAFFFNSSESAKEKAFQEYRESCIKNPFKMEVLHHSILLVNQLYQEKAKRDLTQARDQAYKEFGSKDNFQNIRWLSAALEPIIKIEAKTDLSSAKKDVENVDDEEDYVFKSKALSAIVQEEFKVDPEAAKNTAKSIQHTFPLKTVIFLFVNDALEKGDFEKAKREAEPLKGISYNYSDNHHYLEALSNIVKKQAKVDLEGAKKTIKIFNEYSCHAKTFFYALALSEIVYYERTHNFESAESAFQSMSLSGMAVEGRSKAAYYLILALIAQGQIEKAKKLLLEIKDEMIESMAREKIEQAINGA